MRIFKRNDGLSCTWCLCPRLILDQQTCRAESRGHVPLHVPLVFLHLHQKDMWRLKPHKSGQSCRDENESQELVRWRLFFFFFFFSCLVHSLVCKLIVIALISQAAIFSPENDPWRHISPIYVTKWAAWFIWSIHAKIMLALAKLGQATKVFYFHLTVFNALKLWI